LLMSLLVVVWRHGVAGCRWVEHLAGEDQVGVGADQLAVGGVPLRPATCDGFGGCVGAEFRGGDRPQRVARLDHVRSSTDKLPGLQMRIPSRSPARRPVRDRDLATPPGRSTPGLRYCAAPGRRLLPDRRATPSRRLSALLRVASARWGSWLGSRLGTRPGTWLGARLGTWLGTRLGDGLGARPVAWLACLPGVDLRRGRWGSRHTQLDGRRLLGCSPVTGCPIGYLNG
jgi:hypothetical protein